MNRSGIAVAPDVSSRKRKILILGGTAEARALSIALRQMGGFDVTVSLRGLTNVPQAYAGSMKFGGFGGVEGLSAYLRDGQFEACINATHPFAAQMTENARLAATATGIPLLRLARPGWKRLPDDIWNEVESIESAVEAVGRDDIVFLALGAQGSRPFARLAYARFVIRTSDPVPMEARWSNARYLTGLPNHESVLESDVFQENHVSLLVARNSGGDRGYAKIAAARSLGLPVVMIAPPKESGGRSVTCVPDAVAWLKNPI